MKAGIKKQLFNTTQKHKLNYRVTSSEKKEFNGTYLREWLMVKEAEEYQEPHGETTARHGRGQQWRSKVADILRGDGTTR